MEKEASGFTARLLAADKIDIQRNNISIFLVERWLKDTHAQHGGRMTWTFLKVLEAEPDQVHLALLLDTRGNPDYISESQAPNVEVLLSIFLHSSSPIDRNLKQIMCTIKHTVYTENY